jgi:hypothetical protein
VCFFKGGDDDTNFACYRWTVCLWRWSACASLHIQEHHHYHCCCCWPIGLLLLLPPPPPQGTKSSKRKKQAKLKRVMSSLKRHARKEAAAGNEGFAALHLLHDPQVTDFFFGQL